MRRATCSHVRSKHVSDCRMAGGMNRRDRAPSLAQRAVAVHDTCPARHCWVSDAADNGGVKRPGLLVEWRQARGGWEGRVVYAAELRPGRWALVEEWIPGSMLTQA